MGKAMNILCLAKGLDRYIFLYDDEEESIARLLKLFKEFSHNPNLNFSPQDEKILSQRVRDFIPE